MTKAANNDIGVQGVVNNKDLEGQTIEMNVVVKDKAELMKLINDIQMMPEVTEVERFIK